MRCGIEHSAGTTQRTVLNGDSPAVLQLRTVFLCLLRLRRRFFALRQLVLCGQEYLGNADRHIDVDDAGHAHLRPEFMGLGG